ncbi:PEP-CTERM sorting domain-containing protein [Rubritalea marina]|uniref:PEP-CTERM sorting domain-containing protein n=1 Tax=Rubritalea marina TaxID=361055 RepID=UPI00036FEF1B|nr:PEP-CTERM sorting domain-containing protein [Rubritalea marina]
MHPLSTISNSVHLLLTGALVIPLLLSHSGGAATVTSLDVTASTYVSNLVPLEEVFSDSPDPSPNVTPDPNDAEPITLVPDPFRSQRIGDFNGNGVDALVTGQVGALSYGEASGGFYYTGTNILESSVKEDVDNGRTSSAKLTLGAFAQYEFAFTISGTEQKRANLDFTYNIQISNEQNNSATVFWELQSVTNGRIDALSGEITRSHDPGNSGVDEIADVVRSVDLNAGDYVFTIYTEVPDQEFNNGNKSASASIIDFYGEVVDIPMVPEPSAVSLFGLASLLGLMRRRR